jgi:hypothetical protein
MCRRRRRRRRQTGGGGGGGGGNLKRAVATCINSDGVDVRINIDDVASCINNAEVNDAVEGWVRSYGAAQGLGGGNRGENSR